jgi:hypothetical protein
MFVGKSLANVVGMEIGKNFWYGNSGCFGTQGAKEVQATLHYEEGSVLGSHMSDLTGRNNATEISEILVVMLIQRSHYLISISAHMHSIDHFAVSKPIHDRVILVFII